MNNTNNEKNKKLEHMENSGKSKFPVWTIILLIICFLYIINISVGYYNKYTYNDTFLMAWFWIWIIEMFSGAS
jgi:preprotein translocase subunit SecY